MTQIKAASQAYENLLNARQAHIDAWQEWRCQPCADPDPDFELWDFKQQMEASIGIGAESPEPLPALPAPDKIEGEQLL